MRTLRALLTCAALAAGPGQAVARQWTFVRIADTTTQAPGGTVFSSNDTAPFSTVSLGANGQTAFFGRHPNIASPGIFQGTAGSLTFVADRQTSVPAMPGATFDQGFPSLCFDGVSPTFGAVSSGAGSGIYSSGPAGIYTIVNNQTIGPGGGAFSGVGLPSRDGNDVVFGGTQTNVAGLYRWTSLGINTVVSVGMPQPGGSAFSSLAARALTGQRLAFAGGSASLKGVYTRDSSGAGPISIVADTTTLVPGTALPFAAFTAISADGPNTAFQGGSAGVGGVWAHINGQLIKVIDTNTPGPGGEQLLAIDQVSMSGNNVAFLAQTSIGREIFVWRDGLLSRVVKAGDAFNGISVTDLTMTSQALRGDTVAFTFNTPTGAGPVFGGVYTATYIPAPGAFLALAALAFPHRRRR